MKQSGRGDETCEKSVSYQNISSFRRHSFLGRATLQSFVILLTARSRLAGTCFPTLWLSSFFSPRRLSSVHEENCSRLYKKKREKEWKAYETSQKEKNIRKIENPLLIFCVLRSTKGHWERPFFPAGEARALASALLGDAAPRPVRRAARTGGGRRCRQRGLPGEPPRPGGLRQPRARAGIAICF